MNKEKEMCNKSIKDYVDKVTSPIFEKVLQEDLSNSMTTPKSSEIMVFRANNYRRQIIVKEKTNSTSTRIRRAISRFPMELNINPHTKLISIKNFKKDITIQYGKNTLTAIYSCPILNGNKLVYEIERESTREITHRINEIKQTIQKRIDTALKEFSRKFDLSIPFKKPIWSRHEDYIKGEEVLDSIPRECIIHDTVFKKVYGKGIEFIGGKEKEPIVHLKNYIKNRAIEDIAPEIAESINKFGAMLTGNINLVSQIANLNLEVTKLRRDVTKIQRKKPVNNKDLRKWL